MPAICDLVLPCRDEGPALRQLLPLVPDCFMVIVVDNGSIDDTCEVARMLGAKVVQEERPGYGAAVHAGVEHATAEYLAVMDGDGSFAAADLVALLEAVATGRADLATGRRRPADRGVWPWHARAGNTLVLWWLRRRLGLRLRDIAPMRVCRRADLVALDVRDRRFGYPVELLQKAHRAGWTITEYDVAYLSRAQGTSSKVSGSVRGSWCAAVDFARVLT
jgi:glycosyltransferase involved in cell wall biosynthesis